MKIPRGSTTRDREKHFFKFFMTLFGGGTGTGGGGGGNGQFSLK